MLRTSLILGGLLALATATGCYARGTTRVSASYATPELVYVSPGVQVVADYDYPVFYTSGHYWMYRNGLWFRSRIHNRGFVRVYNPPVVVRRIRNPGRFVRVRARGTVRTRPAARDRRFRRY
jgi:hypothetical protein